MASAPQVNRQTATPELVRAALRGTPKARFTTLQLFGIDENEAEWRAFTYILMAREHGFMVLLPHVEQVYAMVMGETEEEGDHIVITDTVIALESSRGRLLGEGTVYIADIPWLCLSRFRKFLNKPPQGMQIYGFRCRGQLARPVHSSAMQAGLAWVKDVLDEEAAQEYLTAEEAPGDTGDVPNTPVGAADTEEVAALRQRLAQLEGLLKGSGPPAAAPPDGGQDRLLFGQASGGQLSTEEWEQLHAAVGAAPKRLARNEPHPKARVSPSDPLELLLEAEAGREVTDPDAEYAQLASELVAQVGQSQDPMHRMLMLQLKQTSDLVKALLPKTQSDPLSAVLGGSDNASGGSGSGSSGVKGYAARELFLRQIEEEKTVVEHARRNARGELGIAEAREEPALMRQYLEQRIPVGDHKTMAQIGFLAAWGWEQATERDNLQMQAFCARLLFYVEQSCLDSGRTHLSWLLTGVAEPNYQMMSVHKKKPSLSPFARLPPATWVAANISYLKDVDTFESRLRNLGGSTKPAAAETEKEDKVPKRTKKWKGGKGGDTSAADTSHA